MKGWQIALLCLAIAAISVLGTLFFIKQTAEDHQVDTQRYTADQVITVAKAYAGEYWVGGSKFLGENEYRDASWTTVYLGDGKWSVKKNVGKTHNILGGQPWRKTGLSMRLPGELKPS